METIRSLTYRVRSILVGTSLGDGILLSLVSALLASYSINTELISFAPFGIACITAAWCSALNPYFAFGGMAIGCLLSGGYLQAAQGLALAAVILITNNRTSFAPVYKYLISAGVTLVFYPVCGILSLPGLAGYIGIICTTLLISVLFSHAFGGIDVLMGNGILSDERLLTLAFLGGAIAVSFGNLSILGISVGAVFAGVFCVCAVYVRGLAGVACAAAVAGGRVLGCNGDMLLIAVLCCCTLLGSCLRSLGRWWILGGFSLTAIILSILINGSGALTIAETLLVSALFIPISSLLVRAAEENSPAKRSEKLKHRLDFMTCRLVSLAEVLSELSRLFENGGNHADGFIHRQLAGVSDSLVRLVHEDGREKRRSYHISVGCAYCPKKGNAETGDSHSVREIGGRLMATISDGMGSGSAARRESMQAVALMGDLITVGFNLDEAAECVNRLLMLREGGEMYATLDAMLFDPATGAMSLVKHGAPPSYILRDGKLSTLYAEALPVGIIEDARPAVCTMNMHRGDVVVMMSDGISDALGSELIASVSERAGTASGADTAASVLLELAAQRGEGKDDMTVIVAMVA